MTKRQTMRTVTRGFLVFTSCGFSSSLNIQQRTQLYTTMLIRNKMRRIQVGMSTTWCRNGGREGERKGRRKREERREGGRERERE